MKAVELIEKLKPNFLGDFGSEEVAKSAFLMNLFVRLAIAPPQIPDSVGGDTNAMFRACIAQLNTIGDRDISEADVREAHKALAFPMSRAVISRQLYGEGLVTPLGIPASYLEEPKK